MRTERSIGWLEKTRRDAKVMLESSKDGNDRLFWATVMHDCDEEIDEILQENKKDDKVLFRRLLAAVVTVNCIVLILILSGCQLAEAGIRGGANCAGAFGRDIEWIGTKLADNIQIKEK